MSERVMEIVAYIVNAMSPSIDENLISNFEDLSEKLVEQGYTEHEIDSAFSWLIEKLPANLENEFNIEQASHQQERHPLHDMDPSKIQSTAFDMRIQLRELDVIGEAEIEQIVEQALLHGKSGISISEIKALINTFIFNAEDMMEGSFFIFNKNHQVH